MGLIELTASAGLTFVSKSVYDNVLTAIYRGSTAGPATLTAAHNDIAVTHKLTVEPYYLKLNGIEGDQVFSDQSAEGVTLQIALETNGTPRIISDDARLTVEIIPGALHITVPRNPGNAPLHYAPVVLGLTEESGFRVQIAIFQNEPSLTPSDDYNITLANGTRVGMIFQDSERILHNILPGLNETVTLGGVPCAIAFDEYVHSVAISTSGIPGSVWSALDIEANRHYPIDTEKWLMQCQKGYDYFTVLG